MIGNYEECREELFSSSLDRCLVRFACADPYNLVNIRNKILPSPILPVRAVVTIVSIMLSTIFSSAAISIFTLGRKSTTYSAPL